SFSISYSQVWSGNIALRSSCKAYGQSVRGAKGFFDCEILQRRSCPRTLDLQWEPSECWFIRSAGFRVCRPTDKRLNPRRFGQNRFGCTIIRNRRAGSRKTKTSYGYAEP